MQASWRRRTVLTLAALGLALTAYLTHFVVAQARLAQTREHRRLCLFAVICSLAAYCDVHKRLPPSVVTDDNGTPLSSWRMAVLPYSPAASTGPDDTQVIDLSNLDLTQAWDGPKNQSITWQIVPFYCFRHEGTGDPTETNVFAITGPGTAFDANVRQSLPHLPPDTIVVMEVSGTRTPWAAPGDWGTAPGASHAALTTTEDGFHVAFADQSVWHLRSDIPFETFSHFFQIEDARQRNRDQELGPYRIE